MSSAPYQELIDKSREQIVKSRAWAQQSFDEYMEVLTLRPGPTALSRRLHQSRLDVIMVGMKMANSWVDYWMGSVVNYTKMQKSQIRIEQIYKKYEKLT